MKKKLLAVLTGAAVAATCLSVCAACADGTDGEEVNTEQSQNGVSGDQSGVSSESGQPAAPAYGFEEWWQAVTGSLGSDNFASQAEYAEYTKSISGTGEESEWQTNFTTFCERQDDVIHIWEENARVGVLYGEKYVGESYFKYSLNESGVSTEESYDMYSYLECYDGFKDVPGVWDKKVKTNEIPVADSDPDLQWLLGIMYNLEEMNYWDSVWLEPVWAVIGIYDNSMPDFGTTESMIALMKQNAEELYRNKVTYNAQDGSYRIHNDSAGSQENSGYEELIFNFINGKISKLKYVESYGGLYGSHVTTVTVNFSYGNANVTIPEEVKLAAEKTQGNILVAKSLLGKYKLDSADGDSHALLLDNFSALVAGSSGVGFVPFACFGNGKLDNSVSFYWQLISEESVLLSAFSGSYSGKTVTLSIDRGALVYTAEDGTEYRFIKDEQTA